MGAFVAFDDTEFNNASECREYEDEIRKNLCFYRGEILIPIDNIIENINDIDKIVIKSQKALNSLDNILDILNDSDYYEMFIMCNTIGTYKYNDINESYFKLIETDDAMKILSEDKLGRNFVLHDIDGYWWYNV